MIIPFDYPGFWEAIKNGNPTHMWLDFEDGTRINDDHIDVSMGATLYESFNSDEDLTFGKTPSRQFRTRIIMDNTTRNINFTRPFVLQFAVENPIGHNVNISIGRFIGQKPRNTQTAQYVDFTAYDEMILLDKSASDFIEDLTYPKTLNQIISAMETEISMGIDTSSVTSKALQSILSRSYSSSPFVDKEYTFRELLGLIAEACGCYAVTNPNYISTDRFVMQWFAEYTGNAKHTLDMDHTFYIDHSDLYYGLTWDSFDTKTWDQADTFTWDAITGFYADANAFDGVYIRNSNGGKKVRYPSGSKGHMYHILDNPFLKLTNTTTQVTNYIKPIYDRLADLGGVLPMSIEAVGSPAVQAGDIITVELPEAEGGSVKMPIYYRTLRWNGRFTDSYETTAPEAV